MSQELYNTLSLIIMAGGFSIGLITLFMIWRQIVHSVKTREADICVNMAAMSGSSPLKEDIDVIWNIGEEGILDEQQEQAARNVCVFFELVGAIYARGYMSTTIIESFYGSLVTGTFDKLSVFINKKRELSYSRHFAKNFEVLAAAIKDKDEVSPK